MAAIDLKNCRIRIKDGGANYIDLKIGEGNISWTEHKNREYIKDRGKLSTVRDADEEPIDVRFTCIWEFIKAVTASGTPTPIEALYKTGEAASWASVDSDACAPYAVDIEIFNDVQCVGTQDETTTLEDFRVETCEYDPKAYTFSFTGKCNRTVATNVRS